MSRWLKLLSGLLVTAVVAWVYYGPVGQGAAYVTLLQQRAERVLQTYPVNEVPNLQARISRAPLSRTVFLCGPTIDFQRNGTTVFQGSATDYPGIDGRMLQAGGIGTVVWDPPAPTASGDTPPCRPGGPNAAGGTPLLVELLILAVLAWAIGLGLGWVFRRRPAKRGYLG
jgi:hypothetical protein